MEVKVQTEVAEMTIDTINLVVLITADQGQVTLTPPAAVVAINMEGPEIPAQLEHKEPPVVML